MSEMRHDTSIATAGVFMQTRTALNANIPVPCLTSLLLLYCIPPPPPPFALLPPPGIKNDAVAIKAAGLTNIFGVAGSQEHMHAEVTCALLSQSGLLEGRNDDMAAVSFVVRQLVLATDMGRHSEVNSFAACEDVLQAMAAHGLAYAKWGEAAQLKLCCLLLHWADLSNAARSFNIAAAFAVLLGHEQSPAGSAKGTAAAAAAAATATAAAAYAVAGDAAQAAAGAAIAAAVIAASRSGQVSEQQLTLEQLVQEQEVAAVAKAQVSFNVGDVMTCYATRL
jgi:hypothetical protein